MKAASVIDPRSISPGAFVWWQKQIYQIRSFDPEEPLLIHATELKTASPALLSLPDLLLPAKANEKAGALFASTLETLQSQIEQPGQPSRPVTSVNLPERLLAKADAIIRVVETVERSVQASERQASLRGEKCSRTLLLKVACAQLPERVGKSTYYEYRKLFHQHNGDRVRIAASLRRKTFNQTRLTQAQLHFCDTLILRYYARQPPLEAKAVYHIMQKVLAHTAGWWLDPHNCTGALPEDLMEELLNPKIPIRAILDNSEKAAWLTKIELPSLSWFYQYLNYFKALPDSGQTVISARYGKETWEREHLVFDTFVTRATLPLQYVFADHWLFDAFVVDAETRCRLDRLWLTVLIDAYSRSILGMALAYESPCIESLMSALQHSFWPKDSHIELGIEGQWVCFGIPAQLFLDNAWAHLSVSLENFARAISQGGRYTSIDLNFRPPYKGRYGALIERFFGNLSSLVKQILPGAIQSSNPKHIRNAAHEACLLYQDIHKFCQRVIVDYQHTPHRELGGMTPHEKWLEGLQSMYPLVPSLTDELQRQFWRLHPETRLLTQKGVCLFGQHYWSPELSGAQRLQMDGRPIQYGVHYDPANISRIALFQGERWVGDAWAKEMRLPDGSYRERSLWEHQMFKDLAHDRRAKRDWKAYVDENQALGEQRQQEKKKARKGTSKASLAHITSPDTQAIDQAIQTVLPAQVDQSLTDLLVGFAGDEPAYRPLHK